VTNERAPTAYDVFDRYDDAYFQDLAERYRTRNRFARQRIANVFSLLPPLAGKRVLDVGCGMGTFAIEAGRHGAHAVGLDLASAALPAALAVARSEQADAAFVRADAAVLPIRSGSVDVALAADFTEHLDGETLDRIAAELARVVKVGGQLIVYTPSPSHFLERLRDVGVLKQDSSHIGLRPAGELAAAFEAHGFVTMRREYLPSHLPLLKSVERWFGRWVPPLRRRIGIVAERRNPTAVDL
jgi:ubiquinone/menaquinone biosynthesis C-methylase UbiE